MRDYALITQNMILKKQSAEYARILNKSDAVHSIRSLYKLLSSYQDRHIQNTVKHLTLSWRRPLSYRNQSIDLLSKSMDWFLYDNDLRHESVKMERFAK